MQKKRFISFSGGVESTAMCVLYGKGATAIWSDTGGEHDEMYQRMDTVEAMLKALHGGDFELLRIKPSMNTRLQPITNIMHAAIYWRFAPSKRDRWCTKYFKIIPIDNFLKEQGPCELMIGLNADEEPGEDRTGNLMKCENVTYTYPLHRDGKTRDECEEMLLGLGLHPNFPVYMNRGGCFFCMFKEVDEYKAMYFFDRRTFERVRQLEKRIQDRRKKFYSISMSCRSMDDIGAECERELSMWGEEAVKAMYLKIRQSQSCGAFCHR